MNEKWINYIKDIKRRVAEFNRNNKDKKVPRYNWLDSKVQERIMRLWIECRIYEVDINDHNKLEEMAITTLQEDFLKNNLSNNK